MKIKDVPREVLEKMLIDSSQLNISLQKQNKTLLGMWRSEKKRRKKAQKDRVVR